MALNTITQVKLLNGKVVDLVDWTDQPLFSSADFQTGFTVQEMSLFQYVVGDNVPGFGTAAVTRRTATDSDTNISTIGSMASTEEMLVYAIKPEIYFFGSTANNFTTRSQITNGLPGMPNPTISGLAVLNSTLLLRLIISQKVYAEASLGYFNAGFGAYGNGNVVPQAAATGRTLAVNGLPSQEAVRSFVIPHHIGAQEKYRVTLVNPGKGAVRFGVNEATPPVEVSTVMMTLRVNLDGLYKRPTA